MSASVDFFSFIPSLVEAMPIEKAKINNFDWYKQMAADYIKNKPNVHTSRCPGILSVCNQGWIQRAYQDFTIETNGDGESFGWSCEVDQKRLPFGSIFGNYVDGHDKNQLFQFNEFKRSTLKTIIKIQSPWVVKIPDDYSLLSMPIPYNDNNQFTAAVGIIKKFHFLNVQLYWHCLNEKVVVKKGTPLCQYLLLKDENLSSSVNVMNKDVHDKILKLLSHQ